MSAPINTPREALEAILARLVAHAAVPVPDLVDEVTTLAQQGLLAARSFRVDPFYAEQAIDMLPKYRALLRILNNPVNEPEIAKCDRILAASVPEPRGLRDAKGGVS